MGFITFGQGLKNWGALGFIGGIIGILLQSDL